MIKKITCLVLLHSTLLLHSMQETIEYKAPPKYILVNLVTLLCPDRAKQEAHIKKNLDYVSLVGLGACSLQEDLDKSIKTTLFSMLSKIEIPPTIAYDHTTDLYIDDKLVAPRILCAFCTTKTKEDANMIYEHIKDHFNKQDNPFKNGETKSGGWFSSFMPDFSSIKFDLLLKALDFVFNDERRSTVLELCNTMLAILERGKNEHNDLEIIITANMSDQSCRELLKTNNLNDFLTVIHTSDQVGYLTPHKEFYAKLIQEKNIKPEECLVIDDHKENLIGAESLGMRTVYKYNNDQFHDQLKMILASKKPSEKQ